MVTGEYVLALDQGTTNTKAVLVDKAGRIEFRASHSTRITTTNVGHVEQDANEIWNASCRVLRSCVERAAGGAIAAIGITNQRETVILWDRRSGTPVTPAVGWQCRRSADRCVQLVRDGVEPMIQGRTGLRVDPLPSASKVEWLLDHTEGLRTRAEAGEICLGTVDSWLIFKLTAGLIHCTDASNASRTQLLNLTSGKWDDELLQLFRIPAAMLPTVVESTAVVGETSAVEGVPGGISIASAIGDSHAALVGHGVFFPGPAKATYGTGSSLMTLCPPLGIADGALARTIAWASHGKLQYALEGNITMTGATVHWLGDFLQSKTPIETALSLASSVDDSGGVYLVPAMNGLGAPYWDSEAQGAVYGLTRTSTIAHLARAALEGTAHQIADVFEAMQQSQTVESVLYADGGGSGNDRLMQIQADLLGKCVVRSKCAELSALGAAWFAGLTVGIWGSFDELAKMAQQGDLFVPTIDRKARIAMREGWRLAVERTRLQAERPRRPVTQ